MPAAACPTAIVLPQCTLNPNLDPCLPWPMPALTCPTNPATLPAECDNPYDTRYKPERMLIFDKHPGGIGLAAAVGWGGAGAGPGAVPLCMGAGTA